MMGMRVIRVGMQRMWGIRVGMRGMRGIRKGMMKCGKSGWECKKMGGGNEGNKSENLRIEVELMNYNCGEGQETRNCVFRIII